MPLEIEKKPRNSTITLKAPVALKPESQLKVYDYLKQKYGQDILEITFRDEGREVHLLVRRNYQSFHTMENYAARVKELAEGRRKPNRDDDEADDDD